MQTHDVVNHPVAQQVADIAVLPREQSEFLSRDPDAADYLTQKLGVKVTPAALEQRASRGTGPAFRIVLGRAVYSRAALDRRAADQLSAETPYAKRRRKGS